VSRKPAASAKRGNQPAPTKLAEKRKKAKLAAKSLLPSRMKKVVKRRATAMAGYAFRLRTSHCFLAIAFLISLIMGSFLCRSPISIDLPLKPPPVVASGELKLRPPTSHAARGRGGRMSTVTWVAQERTAIPRDWKLSRGRVGQRSLSARRHRRASSLVRLQRPRPGYVSWGGYFDGSRCASSCRWRGCSGRG
jgi:hypothetical protein